MMNLPALHVGVDAPNPFEMTATALHERLAKQAAGSSNGTMKIFDLRPAEEFNSYHIPSSVCFSYEPEMSLAPLAAQLHEILTNSAGNAAGEASDSVTFLFVSLQSPDLDDLIAREVIGEYEESFGQRVPVHAVGILLGGVAGYRERYPNNV